MPALTALDNLSILPAPPAVARPMAWPWPWNVPNLADWQPGDVLVMRGSPNSLVSLFQAAQNDPQLKVNSHWTHCAIYVGDGLMVEAVPWHGARVSRIFPSARARDIWVLRVRGTPDQRKLAAEKALEVEGLPYSTFLIGHHVLNGGAGPGNNPTSLVCSSLVTFALRQAKIALRPVGQHSQMLPASFVSHPWFTPVSTRWHLALP